MATVRINPPPALRIPQQFIKDKEVRKFFEQQGQILFQMWNRMGGSTDSISDSQDAIVDTGIRELYPWGGQQPSKDFRAVTVSSSYTSVSFDFINASVGATISFPEFPDENDVIIIRNGDGTLIPLDGNGKNINGSATGKITRKGTSIEFYYFIDTDEWFAK